MLEKEQVSEIINSNAIFNKLEAEELEAILAIAERKHFSRNQQVFAADQQGQYFYLVETGLFILSIKGGRIKTFKPGDIFGEIAVINENVRTGTIRAMADSTLLAFNGNLLYDDQHIPPKTALKITRALAKRVTNYLRTREQVSTKELIENGENDIVEFKSSLRWNPNKQSKDKLVEHAVLKTIAAFLNTKGGTLIIGVQDDKEIVGIGQDRFENFDKIFLHLTRLIKEYIGTIHIEFTDFEIETIDDKHILRVDCEPATTPAYLKERYGEAFYVRTGPASTNLKVSKIYDYINMRFH